MPFSVACPSCGAKLRAPDNAAGKSFKCPKCGKQVTVTAITYQPATPPIEIVEPISPFREPTPPMAIPVTQLAHEEHTKACSFCGETILAIGKKCKHCGETIDVSPRTADADNGKFSDKYTTYIGKGRFFGSISTSDVEEVRSRFLTDGETLLAIVKGMAKDHAEARFGTLIVTDRRVILRKWFFFQSSSETFDYSDITVVEWQKGFFSDGLVLEVHGKKVNFADMQNGEAEIVASIISQQKQRVKEGHQTGVSQPNNDVAQVGQEHTKAAGSDPHGMKDANSPARAERPKPALPAEVLEVLPGATESVKPSADSGKNSDKTYIGINQPGLSRIPPSIVQEARKQFLTGGETLLAIVKGRVENQPKMPNGLLIVTDRRVILWSHGFLKSSSETFDYSDITGVEWQKGIFDGGSGSGVTFKVHGNKVYFKEMHMDEVELIANIILQLKQRVEEGRQTSASRPHNDVAQLAHEEPRATDADPHGMKAAARPANAEQPSPTPPAEVLEVVPVDPEFAKTSTKASQSAKEGKRAAEASGTKVNQDLVANFVVGCGCLTVLGVMLFTVCYWLFSSDHRGTNVTAEMIEKSHQLIEKSHQRGEEVGREEGWRAGEAEGFVASFDSAEKESYSETIEELYQSGQFQRIHLYTVGVLIGFFVLGFLLQWIVFYVPRGVGFLRDIDWIVLPKEMTQVVLNDLSVPLPTESKRLKPPSAGTALLFLLTLLPMIGCKNREEEAWQQGYEAYRSTAAYEEGWREGASRGEKEGKERGKAEAEHAAQTGLAWQLYKTPAFLALMFGIIVGIAVQYTVLACCNDSGRVPEMVTLALVPAMKHSLAYSIVESRRKLLEEIVLAAENPAIHPSKGALRAFASGKLDDTASSILQSHLDSCPDCCEVIAALSGDNFRHRQVHGRSTTAVPRKVLADVTHAPRPTSQTPIPHLSPELADNQQYEIVRELGHGGMGVVYLAKNKLMDRLEALKVVNKALLTHHEAVERFLHEIHAAAKLSHVNIVTAYSALQVGELLILAMEYAEGPDLASLVQAKGPLPIALACACVQQAACGLQHAFEKGMVHRDIKPQNLVLAREGKKHIVKILDFGLAKATSEKKENTGLTGEGKMLGTPDYIAPEQTLDAAKADIRADIYSLGCTLYYLLSGHPPFSASSLGALLMAHQMQEAKLLTLVRPEVPRELAAVVRKMMAKSPAQRYQTPLEVVQALAPFGKRGATPKASPEVWWARGTP